MSCSSLSYAGEVSEFRCKKGYHVVRRERDGIYGCKDIGINGVYYIVQKYNLNIWGQRAAFATVNYYDF